MSLTVTNYLSQINRDFPVKGQDNDAQVFRDNWQNIYDAISTANSELDSLNNSTIKINSTTTFSGNTLEDINFKNESIEVYELDLQNNLIELDYSKGSYQKFPIAAGIHYLTVINWPGQNKSGKLTLAVTSPCDRYSAINFDPLYINLSSQPNPFELTWNKPNIFELWNEEGSDKVYVRYLSDYTYSDSTSTDLLWVSRLKLGQVNNNSETNTFYTGTNKSTIVQRGGEFGELALVPNRISKTILDVIDKTSTTPVEIILDNATDIIPGAFLYVPNLTTKFTVTQVTTSSIFIEPGNFDIDLLLTEEPITITNPTFVEQPIIVTLSSNPANSEFGSRSNYIGSIYADKNKLEVTYDHYGNDNTNTFLLSTLDDQTEVSATGPELVSTEFIHNLLPIGSVIMWYGRLTDIPYGWTLCDGKGSTSTIINGALGPTIRVPNLTNRFVVGAVSDNFDDCCGEFDGPGSNVVSSTTATTGGSADAVVVNHFHSAQFFGDTFPPHTHSITDPGHNHNNGDFSQLLIPRGSNPLSGASVGGPGANVRDSDSIVPAVTGISINQSSAGTPSGKITINESGTTNGKGANVPPFTSLYFIMKIAGSTDKNPGIVV